MTSTLDFLAHLHRLDVKLRVDGDALHYDAPPGALAAGLRSELVRRKGELLACLRDAQDTARPRVEPIRRVPRDQRCLWASPSSGSGFCTR